MLSDCLILQDPLVPGLWAWMTRLMSRMMPLMRSWTASSSRPPKCPVSEWCRGRGSAPAPTGSLVSASELGGGTRPPGSSLLALYDPAGGDSEVGFSELPVVPGGPTCGPRQEDFVLDRQPWPRGKEACRSRLSAAFATSGQASPGSHIVPRKV